MSEHVEKALEALGKVVLRGVPDKCGYIFYANDVREILEELADDACASCGEDNCDEVS